MRVRVECYSGYKGDERPVRFEIDDRSLFVSEVLARWYSPQGPCFRVRADDGAEYLLRRTGEDTWEIEPGACGRVG
ncbi:MAG: hypothetical protein IT158_25665 [Bryobacterales bacterium]|nr:hypothetical protein [Bryobacterales bacterium]